VQEGRHSRRCRDRQTRKRRALPNKKQTFLYRGGGGRDEGKVFREQPHLKCQCVWAIPLAYSLCSPPGETISQVHRNQSSRTLTQLRSIPPRGGSQVLVFTPETRLPVRSSRGKGKYISIREEKGRMQRVRRDRPIREMEPNLRK